MAAVVKTALGSHFGVGEFTTHFRTDLRGFGCSLGDYPGFDPPMSSDPANWDLL